MKLKVIENVLYFHNKTNIKILSWELANYFIIVLNLLGGSLITCGKEVACLYFGKLICIQFRS